MYLVAIAWMYVVLMMALAEAFSSQGTLLGAFFTLVLYGLLPLSVVLYIMGTPLRKRARVALEKIQTQTQTQTQTQEAPAAASNEAALQAPDAGRVAPGGVVAPVRKEP